MKYAILVLLFSFSAYAVPEARVDSEIIKGPSGPCEQRKTMVKNSETGEWFVVDVECIPVPADFAQKVEAQKRKLDNAMKQYNKALK